MKTISKSGRFRARIIMGFLLAGSLSNCATQHSVKPGHAQLEIDRSKKSTARIRNPKFVNVNGMALSSARTHLQFPAGQQEVTIRFAFPEKDKQDVKLRFKARANQRYSVKFDPFPYSVTRRDKDFFVSGTGLDLIAILGQVGYRVAAKGIHTFKNHEKDVQWADIYVISTDQSEGIVEQVRVP